MLKMSFGQRMKMLRIEKDLNQIDFCKSFNLGTEQLLTTASVSQYEHDKRTPENKRLMELAQYFDVSVDFLLGISENRKDFSETFDPDAQKIIRLLERNEEMKILFQKTSELSGPELDKVLKILKATLPDS